LSKRLFWWAYFWGRRGPISLILEGVLCFKNGAAYIWEEFASENEGFCA